MAQKILLGVLLLLVLLGLSATSLAMAERDIRIKKQECLEHIDNGLWGSYCKVSAINKENCALRCVSPACYELIYAADPLEEGELDFHRGRDFRMCVRRQTRGLPLSMDKLYD